MRVVLSGGGTGGHINPAISIADEIKRRDDTAEISFIGTEKGMESRLIPRAGYEMDFVKVQGFKRSLSPSNFVAAYRAISSVVEAKRILKRIKPDVVVGTGGYASWPALKAAAALGIPTVIHEQNAFPGVTTRKLSKLVDRVCISFKESERFFDESAKHKMVVTGNPISISSIGRAEARKKLGIKNDEIYVLSFGGSLGAEMVNKYVLEAMRLYTGPSGIKHTHAAGKRYYEQIKSDAEGKGLSVYDNIEILDYIYDMPIRMEAADVVICRAGAITLAELAYRQNAAVLIPSPNVTDNHQYKNAKVLSDANAAVLLTEDELPSNKLVDALRTLCGDSAARESMQKKIGEFAKPDAASDIVDAVLAAAAN